MRLVADALEELERAAVVRDEDGLAAAGDEDFLALLRQADDGEFVQPELAQLADGGGELAFAAIHDDEVRQHDFRPTFAGEAALDLDEVFLAVRGVRI